MVKLVVTDMDGTLLNDNKELPKDLFNVIEQLHQKKILFAIASGRAFFDIANYFEPVKDKIIIISDNGSVVYNNGEKIYANYMTYDNVIEVLDAVGKVDNAFANLSGSKMILLQEDQAHHFVRLTKGYKTPIAYGVVKCLKEAAKDDEISKISVLDLINSQTNTYAKINPILKDYNVTVSGINYLDIMKKEVNKGAAIKKIQELYNIKYEETMVFGDYLNDMEMMKSAYHSYAMSNAHLDVIKIANFKAPSNNDEGVLVVIKDLLNKL